MNATRNPSDPGGLYQYETFKTLFNYEIARAQRYPSALALLCISLELQGAAPAGRAQADRVMAEILNKSLRVSDVPARRQDEYLILLPATDENGARIAADRILSRLKNTQQLPAGGLFRMEVYVGIASQHEDKPLPAESLMAEATAAMNNARSRKARKAVAYSEIASGLLKP